MYKQGHIWWTSITYNRKRIRKSLETTDKKLAQAIEIKVKLEILEGRYFKKPIGENKTFRDMAEKFMAEHAPKVSINTQNVYKASLKHILPIFGDSKLTAITPKMLCEYKVMRKNEGAKPATINRELAMMSKAFNLAMKEWEWVENNPMSKVPKEKENERDRWLTEDEEKKLLDNSTAWLRDIIIFDMNTGLRMGELLSLQWNKVNLICRIIIIQESKNGKPRTVPLTQIAVDILIEKSKIRNIHNNLVFTSSVGTKIDDDNLRRAFEKALQKAGIEDFHFHDLRHTFATRLAQRGVDIYTISKLMGHKDIRMTQRYAHHSPESLRVGIQVLEPSHNLVIIGKNQIVSNT
ncbi:MAG: tyrosine-type recombinase/integrase [Candidatus Jettenia sp.]|nr:tyrosine-type recombinase/integrase [Candidatus Jettenia sp.]